MGGCLILPTCSPLLPCYLSLRESDFLSVNRTEIDLVPLLIINPIITLMKRPSIIPALCLLLLVLSCQKEPPQRLPEEAGVDRSRPCDRTAIQLDDPNLCAVVPVIVHVLHNNEPIGQGLNVSDPTICSQIYSLRLDFRKQNSDIGNVEPIYANRATDASVAFYLAGVVRKAKPTEAPISMGEAQLISPKSDAAGIVTGIDINTALHVWVTDLSSFFGRECPLDSWGQYPHQECQTDGVGVDYLYFGYMGRVLTHEVGHWMALHHLGAPAGSNSSSCSTDDGIYDTPNQKPFVVSDCFANPTYACPPQNEPVMYQNFMQVVTAMTDCKLMFTHGQRTKMITTLSAHRPGFFKQECPLHD